jgi:hypothetical protein
MAAAIFKAVGHFRFTFLTDRMSQAYLSSFIGIRQKLAELLYSFNFFKMAAAAIFDLMIGVNFPKSNGYALVSTYCSNLCQYLLI